MNSDTVTRAEVIDLLMQRIGLSRQECTQLLETTLEAISDDLEKGNHVKLAKFGNFVLHDKKSRIGRNPKTGKEAVISSRRVVTFRPSAMLRQKLAKS